MPITEDRAKTALEPYLDQIRHAVETAINTYYTGKEYANTRHAHSARTNANIVYDLIRKNIEQEFDGVKGARCIPKNGSMLLTIDGLVVLRFKKFNRKLLSSNIPTGQTRLLLSQDLPGMPPNGLLHVGYVLDRLDTCIERLYVTCRYESANLWKWDITQPAIVAQAAHEFNVETRRKRRAKVKNQESTEKRDKIVNSGDRQ